MTVKLIDPKLSMLAQSAWIGLYDERLRVMRFEEEVVLAEMFVYETNKMGYRTLITPPFMPNTHLVNFKGVDFGELVRALEGFCHHGNWSYVKFDFPIGNQLAAGFPTTFNVHQKYTYRLNSLINWRDGATSKLRNDINKLDRYSFSVSNQLPKHIDFFLAKLKTVGFSELEIMQRTSQAEGFYFVEEATGKFVACCLQEEGVVYYLAAANEKSDRTVATCGLAYCIDEAHRRGVKIFDFEGSMIPGVEAYFKKFGGDRTYYLSMSMGKGWKYRLRNWIRR